MSYRKGRAVIHLNMLSTVQNQAESAFCGIIQYLRTKWDGTWLWLYSPLCTGKDTLNYNHLTVEAVQLIHLCFDIRCSKDVLFLGITVWIILCDPAFLVESLAFKDQSRCHLCQCRWLLNLLFQNNIRKMECHGCCWILFNPSQNQPTNRKNPGNE